MGIRYGSAADLPEQCDVVVVGAGLAGLAAAVTLHRAKCDVVVLEASDGVGGRVRSDVVDGFTLDRGFQILLTAYPEVQKRVSLTKLRMRHFSAGVVVWDGRRFHTFADPLRHPLRALRGTFSRVLTAGDKLRLLRQRISLVNQDARKLLSSTDYTTMDALRGYGFSERSIQNFFIPFLAGIHLDPSLNTSHRMYATIQRSLMIGESGVPAGGMGQLSLQVARRMPTEKIFVNAPVKRVRPHVVTLASGRTIRAARVVVATQEPVAVQLLGPERIYPKASNPVSCVWFAADKAPVKHRYIMVDGTRPGMPMNVAVMSNIAPEYAPQGKALIVAALPGVTAPDAAAWTRPQLQEMFGEQVASWRVLRTDVIHHGQPRQDPPFAPKENQVLGESLFVCGDHRDTASVQGAMFSGRRCAKSVLRSLAEGGDEIPEGAFADPDDNTVDTDENLVIAAAVRDVDPGVKTDAETSTESSADTDEHPRQEAASEEEGKND